MPKNRHFTFGETQAQKAREEKLAKLRAMMKPPAEGDGPSQPAATVTNPTTTAALAPGAARATQAKNPSKATAKKAAAKKKTAKK